MTRENLIAKSYENGFNAAIDRVMNIVGEYDLYKSDEDGDLVCCRSEVLGEIEHLKILFGKNKQLKGGEQE